MRNKAVPPIVIVLGLAVTACGALFNKSVKSVAMGSEPSEAEVWVDGNRMGVTPVTLELDNHESHTVVFRKEGFKEVTCQLKSSAKAGWIILDVLGALLPVIIDAATGEWKGISQDVCNVNLPSVDGGNAGRVGPADRGLAKLAEENGWVILQ